MNRLTSLGIFAGALLTLGSACIYTVYPGERVNEVLYRHWFSITSGVWSKTYTIPATTSRSLSSKFLLIYSESYHLWLPTEANRHFRINRDKGSPDRKHQLENPPTTHRWSPTHNPSAFGPRLRSQSLQFNWPGSSEDSCCPMYIPNVILDDADQLLKNRETISREIRSQLYAKARDFNVNV